jgi:hypothetical protein
MVLARPVLAAAGVAAPLLTIAALVAGGPVWIPAAVLAWGALVALAVTMPGRRAFVFGWAGALIAFVVGLFAHYAVAVDHALCGGGRGSTAFAAAAAIAVYLAASLWALRTGRRALWAWPAIVLLAWGVHLALLLALPGAHGYCET